MIIRLAKLSSILFHPLLVFVYSLGLFVLCRPLDFISEDEKAKGVLIIMTVMTILVFPVLGVFLMKKLSMISTWQMEDRKERIGPLIATSTFYIWYFINIRNNFFFPDYFIAFCLGAVIAILSAFFINNFTRISLHAIGASSLATGLTLFFFDTNTDFLNLTVPFLGGFRVSSIFVLFLIWILSGWIGSARLVLRAHSSDDVYGGFVVGILAQVISYKLFG